MEIEHKLILDLVHSCKFLNWFSPECHIVFGIILSRSHNLSRNSMDLINPAVIMQVVGSRKLSF